MKRFTLIVAVLGILAFTARAFAQADKWEPNAAPRELHLSAVAVARPALAHPLLPEVTELEHGDAAQMYLTACLLSTQARAKAAPPAPADGQARPESDDDKA